MKTRHFDDTIPFISKTSQESAEKKGNDSLIKV